MSATIQSTPKLPGFLSLLLVIVLGVLAAKLMWMIITPKTTSIGDFQTIESTEIKVKEKVNYGKLIANQHLFGVVKVKKTPVKKTPKVVKKPKVVAKKLNLKLHGIVAYKSNDGGYALISTSGGSQKVYGLGDTVQKGVLISKIFSDKVILDNNGTSEELLLPAKGKTASTRRQTPSSVNLQNLPGAIARKQQTKSTANNNNIDLNKLRQDIVKNPQKLLEIVKPTPAVVNGNFIGFRVRPGRKRQEFRKFGLRPNDVITEINGIILDDSSKGLMLASEIEQANNLSITVKRGSKIIALPQIQF